MSRTQNTYMFSPKKDTSTRTSNVMYRGRRGDITPQKGVDQKYLLGPEIIQSSPCNQSSPLKPILYAARGAHGDTPASYGDATEASPRKSSVQLFAFLISNSPKETHSAFFGTYLTCFQFAALPLLYLRPTHAERRSPST